MQVYCRWPCRRSALASIDKGPAVVELHQLGLENAPMHELTARHHVPTLQPATSLAAVHESDAGTKTTSHICPKLRQWLTPSYRRSGVASNRRRCSLMA